MKDRKCSNILEWSVEIEIAEVKVYTKEAQLTKNKKAYTKRSSRRKKLIKQLDAFVTSIVQKRDKKCVTCGALNGIYCGHYHSRTHYATRWDLMNCHAQCNPCNARHEHDPYPYTKFMLTKYGVKKMDELYEKHRQQTHLKVKDLEQLLNELQQLAVNDPTGAF